MNTQLLFCIKANNNWSNLENISRILIFAVQDLPRNTANVGRRENFPFYGMVVVSLVQRLLDELKQSNPLKAIGILSGLINIAIKLSLWMVCAK